MRAAWAGRVLLVVSSLLAGCALPSPSQHASGAIDGPPTPPTESAPGPSEASPRPPSLPKSEPPPTPPTTTEPPPPPNVTDPPPLAPPTPPPTSPPPPRPTPPTPVATMQATPYVAPRSVQFEAGADAGPRRLSRQVTGYSLAPDGSNLGLEVAGVADASLQVDSLFRLHNVDSDPHAIRLSAPVVTDPSVLGFTLVLREGTNPAGVLDLRAARSLNLTLAPGTVLDAALTLTLSEGATSSTTVPLRLEVDPA